MSAGMCGTGCLLVHLRVKWERSVARVQGQVESTRDSCRFLGNRCDARLQ